MTTHPELDRRQCTVVDVQENRNRNGNITSECSVLIDDENDPYEVIVSTRYLESLIDESIDVLLKSGADVNMSKQVKGELCSMV